MKMPYVTSFVFCDSIEKEYSNSIERKRINNPLTQLTPIALPGNYTFSYSISISDVDIHRDNNLKLIFVADNRETLLLDLNIPKDSIPSDDNNPVLSLDGEIRNYVFKDEGIAEMKLVINEEIIHVQKIRVVRGQYD